MIKWIALVALVSFTAFAGVEFDGTDDHINCGSDASVDDLGTQTLAMWAWVNVDGDPDIAAGKDTTGLAGRLFYLRLSGNGSLEFFKHCTTAGFPLKYFTVGSQFSTGQWHHWAVTWDGTINTNGVHIYVDGVECNYDAALSANGQGAPSSDAALPIILGSGRTNNLYFDGTIDEAALWTTVLTAAEVAHLASSRVRHLPLQIQASSLVGYWPLDDEEDGTSGDGDTFRDISANENTGTGDDGGNNTGLTCHGSPQLSYP